MKSSRENNKITNLNIRYISLFVLMVLFIIFMNDYFTPVKKPVIHDENVRPEYIQLQKIKEREDKVLSSYRIINAEKGIYQIPVDRAVQIITDEYAEKQKN